MEARATLRGTGVSKGFVAIVAIMVALALGAGAAVLAKSVTGSTAAPAAHIAQVKSGASDPGSAWNYGVRRGGIQSVEGPATPANSFLGPDAQERNTRLAAQPIFREGYGY